MKLLMKIALLLGLAALFAAGSADVEVVQRAREAGL